MKHSEDRPLTSGQTPLGRMIETRLSRRTVLRSGAALSVVALSFGSTACSGPGGGLSFKELPHGATDDHAVADGYDARVLIRWGDPILANAPDFEPNKVTAEAQRQQFGTNNDFIAFMPLPKGSTNSDHGLLCVNHEFCVATQMFADVNLANATKIMTAERGRAELASIGHSVVEIKKSDGTWALVDDSKFNRRLTALDTEMELTGPAAGHERLQTSEDKSGRKVIGTLFNCAGGKTPWHTVLIAEENVHFSFSGTPKDPREAANHRAMGFTGPGRYPWRAAAQPRFDLGREPREPNRFGWIVEYDPYDPQSVPKKRTALGRFRHEGAGCVLNHDGRIVVYQGDDARFECVYRYVSDDKFDADNPEANEQLLDKGTLYVGRFEEDGSLNWLPLVHGSGPLVDTNGFDSQADVLIETRRAARFVGGTPMDRPEDIDVNPVTGTVFLMLTNNTEREADETGAANPRGPNPYGHILEFIPPVADNGQRDHTADRFEWDVFIKAGDPSDATHEASYNDGISPNGWFGAPDNCAFDPKGRLWIATDGAPEGINDGVWACEVSGSERALTRHFYRVPHGAELCGPEFTPDGETLFVAVQHPGLSGPNSLFDNPSTRWPDFRDDMPPRSAVVAITRKGGGEIGS